jgi:predicted acylesterase/phospholipase RssA
VWTSALDGKSEDNPFSEPFDDFWRKHGDAPRLFLNSTWVERGSRTVISYPMAVSLDDTVDGDALAFFTLVQAVHASARFPYISPALTIPGISAPWGHLVDGGYFENSGAATAREVLDLVAPAATPWASRARAIVIRYCENASASVRSERWATELAAPVATFFATRDARETLAIAALERAYPEHVEFCLASEPQQPELPLGWLLSQRARREIDKEAGAALATDGTAAKVYGWLRTPNN